MKKWMVAVMVGGVLASGGMAKDQFGETIQLTQMDAMVKFTHLDKSSEYKMMTYVEFQEIQDKYKATAALYPKALELAKKEWAADKAHGGRPFPVARVCPEKVDLADRLRSSDRYKPSKSDGGQNMSKEEAEKTYVMPKKWKALLDKNSEEVKEPRNAAEKQARADANEAVTLLTAKLRELEEALSKKDPPADKDKPDAPEGKDPPAEGKQAH